jgi:hypothetical protein
LYLIPGALTAFASEQMRLFANVTTGVVFIIFFLLSPVFSKHLFYSDWSDEFHLADMTETTRQAEHRRTPGIIRSLRHGFEKDR